MVLSCKRFTLRSRDDHTSTVLTGMHLSASKPLVTVAVAAAIFRVEGVWVWKIVNMIHLRFSLRRRTFARRNFETFH